MGRRRLMKSESRLLHFLWANLAHEGSFERPDELWMDPCKQHCRRRRVEASADRADRLQGDHRHSAEQRGDSDPGREHVTDDRANDQEGEATQEYGRAKPPNPVDPPGRPGCDRHEAIDAHGGEPPRRGERQDTEEEQPPGPGGYAGGANGDPAVGRCTGLNADGREPCGFEP
jgi:hypothetical protein